MQAVPARSLQETIRRIAHPLVGQETDYAPLLDRIGDARFVLLGEATHGSHEFYRERARITRQLILQKGFTAIAVEADWPDAYQVNRYIKRHGGVESAVDALAGFKRFPTWMWRNADVLDFVGWLRQHNETRTDFAHRVGFYGLDLYSLHRSISAVIAYLEKVDPKAAQQARYRYSCFEHFGEEPQYYGYATTFGLSESCEHEVIQQLVALRQNALSYLQRDGEQADDDLFYAEQNAQVVRSAEEYYRSMFQSQTLSWNIRDSHMVQTLEQLTSFLERGGRQAKVVVWAHNSHVGDARATENGASGQYNIGQLMRQHHPQNCVLVGFTTYGGTVTAASDWDAPVERKRVIPALPGSYEALFHEVGLSRFLLQLNQDKQLQEYLRQRRLERAIGVIYRPESERLSHYFFTRLAEQFDVVIHLDETRAVEPLERTARWIKGDYPETYPFAV